MRLFHGEQEKRFVFHEFEVTGGLICNPTKIMHVVKNYLQQNRLTNLAGKVVFSQSLLHEQLIAESDLMPQIFGELQVCLKLHKFQYYVAILRPENLYQYRLFFWRLGIYIEGYTVQMAYILKYYQQADSNFLNGIENLVDLHNFVQTRLCTEFGDLVRRVVV